jgi:hypothetical protein
MLGTPSARVDRFGIRMPTPLLPVQEKGYLAFLICSIVVNMQRLNPFTRKTIPYHRVSKESSENDNNDSDSSTTIQKGGHNEEEDYLLTHHLHRTRRSRWGYFCGYFFVALISLLVGLILSQFIRLEHEIDDFIGMLPPYSNQLPAHHPDSISSYSIPTSRSNSTLRLPPSQHRKRGLAAKQHLH